MFDFDKKAGYWSVRSSFPSPSLRYGPVAGGGGGGHPKIFFRPFGTQFGQKIRGVGAGPGQYTLGNEFLLFCIAEVVKSNLWSFCRPTLPVFCVPSLLTSGILTLPCILVLLSLTL